MTIKHMKIFLEVYRNQNITKAAAVLNMTQPAVTRAVKEIEKYYGICLFERINQRLYITEGGTHLYSHAIHLVESFDQMEQELKNWDAGGSIRIGASIMVGNYLMPQLVKEFQVQFPETAVKVMIANGSTLQKKLLDNEIDIMILEGSSKNPDFIMQQIGFDRLVLIIPPGHQLEYQDVIMLDEIINYPVLLREKGSNVRTLVDNYFAVRNISLEPVWESASTQAIVKAVSCGIGVSFLPEQLVEADAKNGKIIIKKVKGLNLSRERYLVWHKRKHLTKAIRNFIELCEGGTGCKGQ